jgi:hypothetical protein
MGKKKSKLSTIPEVRLKRRKVIDQVNKLQLLKKKPSRLPKPVFFHAEDFVKSVCLLLLFIILSFRQDQNNGQLCIRKK